MRSLAVAAVVAAALWIACVAYWWDSAAYDCYPHCSTAQQATGWGAAILLLVLVGLLVAMVVKVVRALKRRT